MINTFKKDEFEELKNNGKVVLFFTANWCGYCKMLNLELEELEKKYSDLTIIKVDIEKHKKITIEYGIMSIPVLVLYNNGSKIRSIAGYKPLEVLEKFIKV